MHTQVWRSRFPGGIRAGESDRTSSSSHSCTSRRVLHRQTRSDRTRHSRTHRKREDDRKQIREWLSLMSLRSSRRQPTTRAGTLRPGHTGWEPAYRWQPTQAPAHPLLLLLLLPRGEGSRARPALEAYVAPACPTRPCRRCSRPCRSLLSDAWFFAPKLTYIDIRRHSREPLLQLGGR